MLMFTSHSRFLHRRLFSHERRYQGSTEWCYWVCHSSSHFRRCWYWCSEDDGGTGSASTAISKRALCPQISILTYFNFPVTRELWSIARGSPRTFTTYFCRCIGPGCEVPLQISRILLLRFYFILLHISHSL